MLSTTTSRPILVSVFCLTLLVAHVPKTVQAECDACLYDGTDSSDCKVYGKIDGELIGWYKASEECKDIYDIVINSPSDPDIICASANSFVNDLKLGSLQSSTAKLGLGVAEGGFFEQDGNAILLKDTITIGGTTYDCQASESDCYNAMKPYFESDPEGMKEMQEVCDTLYNQAKVDRELEDSILRNRLCQEVTADPALVDDATLTASCNPLLGQLLEQMEIYGDKNCTSFSMGPGSTVIPGCENIDSGETTTDDDVSRETSAGVSIHCSLKDLFLMIVTTLAAFVAVSVVSSSK